MKTVTFGSLKIGDKFILWALGTELYFTKISATVAETGTTAVGLGDSCEVFPAI